MVYDSKAKTAAFYSFFCFYLVFIYIYSVWQTHLSRAAYLGAVRSLSVNTFWQDEEYQAKNTIYQRTMLAANKKVVFLGKKPKEIDNPSTVV